MSARRPTRRDVVRGAAAAALGTACASAAPRATRPVGGRRPNVLWILSDQHRHDVAGYAGDPHAVTPALDRLAAQSGRLEDLYCQVPLCVPARQSLLTGTLAHVHGNFRNSPVVPPGERTIAHAFTEAGYRTALFGKAHCNVQGFEVVRDFHEALADFEAEHGRGRRPGDEHWYRDRAEGERDYVTSMNPGMRTAGDGPRFFMEREVTADAARFLAEHDGERPFFLWASYLNPHPPLFPPDEFHAMFSAAELPLRGSMAEDEPGLFHFHKRRRRRQELDAITPDELLGITRAYYASLAWTDTCIGGLLDAVDRLDLARDTIVVYTSDHGEMLGEHGLVQKRSFHEAALRVPGMVRFPGRIPAGRSHARVAEHLDLVATIFDLTGVPRPEDLRGRSLAPVLRGEPLGAWDDAAIAEMLLADRPGEDRTSHAGEPPQGFGWAIRVGDYKYVEHSRHERALHDVVRDPLERANRIDDPDHAERVQAMRDRLAAACGTAPWNLREA